MRVLRFCVTLLLQQIQSALRYPAETKTNVCVRVRTENRTTTNQSSHPHTRHVCPLTQNKSPFYRILKYMQVYKAKLIKNISQRTTQGTRTHIQATASRPLALILDALNLRLLDHHIVKSIHGGAEAVEHR